MRRLKHPALDHILWHPEPDDPFEGRGFELMVEGLENGPKPPEAEFDADTFAAAQLVTSYAVVGAMTLLHNTGLWVAYGHEPQFPPMDLILLRG